MTVENLQLNVRTNAGNASQQFSSLADALNRVRRAAGHMPSNRISAGLNNISKSAKKATEHTNKLLSSFLRIGFYRAIRSAIKAITDAFAEGLQNAYAFSDAIVTEGHRFAVALDSVSSAGLKMKNQLGSALISLLTALEPLITTAINLITKLADAMSQLFAIFTGGTYLKAMDVPNKWATAAGGAAKKAKEWKNQLLGFDEINRLEEPSNPSGGGGSGEPDVMSMFQDTPIDGIFAKIKAKLDELRDSLNFEPLREVWDRLKESVGALADTIMQGFGWAWNNILVPLSHWTIERLAPELVLFLANALDVLNAILRKLAPYIDWFWKNVLKPLFSFIGDVVIKELQSLNGFLEKLADLINGKVTFNEFINGLSDSELFLGAVLTAITLVVSVTGVFNTIMGIASAVVGVFSTVLAFLAANPIAAVIVGIGAMIAIGIILYRHWDEIITKLKEFQQTLHNALNDGQLDWLDFVAVIVRTIMAPIDGIINLVNWIVTLCNWIKSALEGLDRLNFVKKANNRAQEITDSGEIWNGMNFANGGFPPEGQLFVSREAGPEMVGTIGGHTAVANNDQIVEGIRQGVYDAVTAANSNGERQVDVRVYLDSREIKIGQNRLSRAMGV